MGSGLVVVVVGFVVGGVWSAGLAVVVAGLGGWVRLCLYR